jgi:hypothetical protein
MYIIRTLKLKKWLENKGFKVEGTIPNKDIPNFLVWLFEDSKEIRQAVKEYCNS